MCFQSSRTDTGFTLIELLVAVTMTAIIAAVLFGMLGGTISNWQKAENHMNEAFHDGNLYILLSSKLENLWDYDSKTDPGKYFSAEPDRVKFISYSSVLFQYFPVITEIYVDQNKLILKETPFFWDRPNTDLPEPKEMTLTDKVSKLDMGYLMRDMVKKDDPGEWVDHWSSDKQDTRKMRDIRFVITWEDGRSMIVSHPLKQKEDTQNVRPRL